MRYALMIEPQQGLSYDDQLAIARRAEAAGFETLFRSDHYDSFPGELGRPRPTPGRCSPASPARRSGSGSASSSRRSRSGTPGRWRRSSSRSTRCPAVGSSSVSAPAGTTASTCTTASRSRRSRCGPRCSRSSSRSCAASGRSPTAGRSTAATTRCRARSSGRARSQQPRRTSSSAAEGSPRSMRIAVRFADEFNVIGSAPERVGRALREARRDGPRRGRDPATLVHSAMVGRSSGATRPRWSALGGTPGAVRARRRRRGLVRGAPAALDLRHARRGPRDGRALRRRRGGAAHAPGLPALGPRDDRPARRGAGPRLTQRLRPRAYSARVAASR